MANKSKALPGELDAKQRAFLSAYAKLGCITSAAKAAKCNRRSHSYWIKEEGHRGDVYRREFRVARKESIQALESEARRRAMIGVRKLVTHQGQPVFVWVDSKGNVVDEGTPRAKRMPLYSTDYSDTMLIFLLKAAKPEKYRERFDNRHSGPGGGPIVVGLEKIRQELLGREDILEQQRSQPDS